MKGMYTACPTDAEQENLGANRGSDEDKLKAWLEAEMKAKEDDEQKGGGIEETVTGGEAEAGRGDKEEAKQLKEKQDRKERKREQVRSRSNMNVWERMIGTPPELEGKRSIPNYNWQ